MGKTKKVQWILVDLETMKGLCVFGPPFNFTKKFQREYEKAIMGKGSVNIDIVLGKSKKGASKWVKQKTTN